MVAGRSTLEKAIPPGLRRGEAREEGTRHSGEPRAGRIRRQSGERSPAELHSGRPGRRHRGPPLPEAGFFGPRTRVVRRWLKPAACTQPGRCSPRAAPRVTSRSAPQRPAEPRPRPPGRAGRGVQSSVRRNRRGTGPRYSTRPDGTGRHRAGTGRRPRAHPVTHRGTRPCPQASPPVRLPALPRRRAVPPSCASVAYLPGPARGRRPLGRRADSVRPRRLRRARSPGRTCAPAGSEIFPNSSGPCGLPGIRRKEKAAPEFLPLSEQTFTERLPHHGPWGTDEEKEFLRLLWQRTVKSASSVPCFLHTSSRQADSNRASVTRLRRQAYARLYPVLLVKQDGSTIHIRYREPRRMLVMPLDLDTLTPEERRARFRKREALLQQKKEEEPELVDGFDTEQYRQFWSKTRK
ncbi:collagen alpha-2(I) chain-like [Dipodomys merriami]|uniref:collagen alpha-2(I) chain-like n=1 Tax=Dipodomys merriami TaxID=94247 RepID=UPI003855BFF0